MFLAGNAGGVEDTAVIHLDSTGDYIWNWEWTVGGSKEFMSHAP